MTRVFDPFGHRLLEVEELDVLPAVDGLIPCRAASGGEWFAWETWTNRSYKLSELEFEPHTAMRTRVLDHDLIEHVLGRCDDVRGLGQVPPIEADEAQQALARLLPDTGWPVRVRRCVLEAARNHGFSTAEIAFALLTLNDAPALPDVLRGVEVVSVSQIAEEMRVHVD